MSSQRGNSQKRGPPKHQNKVAFKNDLHDKTKKIQAINSISVSGCCVRCKEIIEWKIKYKKYKPLTQAKKCVRCSQKAVKKTYYVMCDPCAEKHKVCAKCAQPKEIVLQQGLSPAEEAAQQSQLQQELKFLSERQRRAFYRGHAAGQLYGEASDAAANETLSDDEDDDSDDNDQDTADGSGKVNDNDIRQFEAGKGVDNDQNGTDEESLEKTQASSQSEIISDHVKSQAERLANLSKNVEADLAV